MATFYWLVFMAVMLQRVLGPAAKAVKGFASSACFSGENGAPLQFLEFPSQTPPVLAPVSSENCQHSTEIAWGC